MFFSKMHCYVIPPLKHLDMMDLGDDYFCLAHFYLKYPHYKEFFRKVSGFVTLDNSAAERSLVTTEKLLSIVCELQPNEVIAPDILFDKKQTLKNLKEFAFLMKSYCPNRYEGPYNLLHTTKLFGCPQGKTRREWLDCYMAMLDDPNISVIGLSKISVPFCWLGKTRDVGIKEARQECVGYLSGKGLIQKPLHCLGMGDPTEYWVYDHPLIRSTDSCYTVLAAKHGIEFQKGNFKRVETTNDFYEKRLSEKAIKIAKANIKFLKGQFVTRSY